MSFRFCQMVGLPTCMLAITAAAIFVSPMSASKVESDEATVRFVDTDGKPISDVEAIWFRDGMTVKLETRDGHSTLTSNEGIVVARMEGFQFSGLVLGEQQPDGNEFTIQMLRKNEKPAKLKTTLPVPFDDATRVEVLGNLETFFAEKLANNPMDGGNFLRCMTPLMLLNPDETLKFVLAQDAYGPDFVKPAIRAAVGSFLNSDFERTAELIDSIKDPNFRALTIGTLLRKVPFDHPNRSVLEKQMIKSMQMVKKGRLAFFELVVVGRILFDVQETGTSSKNRRQGYSNCQ